MTSSKHPLAALAVYIAVLLTLLGGIGIALATVVRSTGAATASPQEKTALQVQVESAREVREALARPIAGPTPLGPITAKLAKPPAKVAALPTPKRNTEQAMRRGREAFASIDAPPTDSFFGFLGFDRHTMR
jgi:hypothetical protein